MISPSCDAAAGSLAAEDEECLRLRELPVGTLKLRVLSTWNVTFMQVVGRRVHPHSVSSRGGAGAELCRGRGGRDAGRDGRGRLRAQPRAVDHRRRRQGNTERSDSD